MNNTERIELYLLGKLSQIDKKAFEEELIINPILKEELALQKEVIAYVKQKDFVNEIGKAHQKYSDNKGFSPLWIWGGIFLLGAVLTSYFFLANSEKEHYVEYSKYIKQEEKNVIDSTVSLQNIESVKIEKVINKNNKKPIVENIQEDKIEFYQRKHKELENFIFKTNQAKQIITKSGIKLNFPANAFEGNISTIQLEIEEYVTKSDIILADLTTLTNDKKQLISEGMLCVKATNPSTGEEVKLKNNVKISFPKNGNKSTDFKPFIGQENQQGEIEWVLQKEEMSIEPEEETVEKRGLEKWEKGYIQKNARVGLISPRYYRQNLKMYLEKELPNEFFINKKTKEIVVQFVLDKKLQKSDFKISTYQGEIKKDKNLMKKAEKANKKQKEQEETLLSLIEKMPTSIKWTAAISGQDTVTSTVKLPVRISPEGISFGNIIAYQTNKQIIKDKINDGQKLTERDINYYVFSLSSLGWINCDRFISVRNRKKFTMKIDNPYANDLRLVFKKYKSILPSYQNSFANIIEGEEVSLIGIVRVNDELKIAKTDFVTQKGYVPTLEYQSIDEKGLIEFAKSFD